MPMDYFVSHFLPWLGHFVAQYHHVPFIRKEAYLVWKDLYFKVKSTRSHSLGREHRLSANTQGQAAGRTDGWEGWEGCGVIPHFLISSFPPQTTRSSCSDAAFLSLEDNHMHKKWNLGYDFFFHKEIMWNTVISALFINRLRLNITFCFLIIFTHSTRWSELTICNTVHETII